MEWLLTVPNFQVEMDLSASEYNDQTALLGIKFNWDTYHKMAPFYVFNAFDLRGEYRYHFRFVQQKPDEKFHFFSLARPNPRPNRAYYLGGYADWSSYSIKPAATGRQGWQAGLGVSAGVEFPLYEYERGAVDLDLGLSAGVLYTRFQDYELNDAATAYVYTGGGGRNMVIPFVTELRATFAWRRYSVRTRYVKKNPDIPIYKQAVEDIDTDFKNTNKENFDDYQKSMGRLPMLKQSDTTYRREFTEWVNINRDDQLTKNVEQLPISDKYKKKLRSHVNRRVKEAIADFNAKLRKEQAEAAGQARKAKQAQAKAAKEQAKVEKEKAKTEKEKTKVGKEKVKKEKKGAKKQKGDTQE